LERSKSEVGVENLESRSRTRKFWKCRGWSLSRIFQLRLRNPAVAVYLEPLTTYFAFRLFCAWYPRIFSVFCKESPARSLNKAQRKHEVSSSQYPTFIMT